MSRRTLILAILAIIMVATVLVGVAVDTAISLHAISQSQSQWCDALRLLTVNKVAAPSDPQKTPGREELYHLYEAYLHLESQFGCKG